MAIGPALTLLGVFLLQLERCEYLVRGALETSEPLRLAYLYREGNREEALQAFEELPEGAVDEMIERVNEVRQMSALLVKDTFGPNDSCLHAASLLETELAMMLALRSQWDGADAHFDSARRVSFLIGSYKLQERYQRDWLLAAGLFFHELIFFSEPGEAFWRADRFLDKAVKDYPKDPEILLAAGALLEWSGSLRFAIESHLKEAEALYSRALELAPDDPEALLRHGLVLRKLGRNDEAAPPLLRVLESDAGDDLVYRSRMGLGGLAEGAGNLPEAIENYEAASKLIPSWQVARLAVSHALHSSGDHERARKVLDEALAMKDSEEALLGWWSYELGLAPRFKSLFQRMRDEATR